MKSFNSSVWKKDARIRRDASLAVGRDPEQTTKKWKEDLRFIRALSKTIDWCTEHRVTVEFSGRSSGSYDPATGTVTVNHKSSPMNQLFVLLHELGHFMVACTEKGQRFSKGYRNVNPKLIGSNVNRLDILDEEFEAWGRGWSLGEHLNILKKEDRKTFDRIRVNSLKEYLRWSLKTHGYM